MLLEKKHSWEEGINQTISYINDRPETSRVTQDSSNKMKIISNSYLYHFVYWFYFILLFYFYYNY